ncbi:MAG: hypothetical protein FJW27_10285 [Acidimicrobiia bacterium]|nr:hypothetical protein [Acidimicrobiia bacterium]
MSDQLPEVLALSQRVSLLEEQFAARRFSPQVLEAQCLTIRDSDGNARIRLEANQGCVCFAIFDREGVPRAELSLEDDETRFVLHAADGVPTVGMAQLSDGSTIGLGDKNRNRRAWLSVGEDGAFLYLAHVDGQPRVGLTAASNDVVGLALLDPAARARVTVALEPSGPYIELADAEGNPLYHKP